MSRNWTDVLSLVSRSARRSDRPRLLEYIHYAGDRGPCLVHELVALKGRKGKRMGGSSDLDMGLYVHKPGEETTPPLIQLGEGSRKLFTERGRGVRTSNAKECLG